MSTTTALSCCVCGMTDALPWRTGRDLLLGGEETFRAVRCARCGTRRLDPRPPESEMARYYAPATYARAEDENSEVGKRLDAYTARLADKAGSFAPAATGPETRRALDVGCGDGRFLAALATRGWQVAGTETDPVAAALARGRVAGGAIHDGTLDTLPEPDASFDLISLVHVLEHVPDPRATLADCLRLLRPGGLLLLALPNAGSLEARVFGSAWYHLDLPRHLWGFTPRTLTRLVEEVGFSVCDLAYTPLLFAPQSVVNAVRGAKAAGAPPRGSGPPPRPSSLGPPLPPRPQGGSVAAAPLGGGVGEAGGGGPNTASLKTRVFRALLGFSNRLGRAVPGEIMEMIAAKPEGAGR